MRAVVVFDVGFDVEASRVAKGLQRGLEGDGGVRIIIVVGTCLKMTSATAMLAETTVALARTACASLRSPSTSIAPGGREVAGGAGGGR